MKQFSKPKNKLIICQNKFHHILHFFREDFHQGVCGELFHRIVLDLKTKTDIRRVAIMYVSKDGYRSSRQVSVCHVCKVVDCSGKKGCHTSPTSNITFMPSPDDDIEVVLVVGVSHQGLEGFQFGRIYCPTPLKLVFALKWSFSFGDRFEF